MHTIVKGVVTNGPEINRNGKLDGSGMKMKSKSKGKLPCTMDRKETTTEEAEHVVALMTDW